MQQFDIIFIDENFDCTYPNFLLGQWGGHKIAVKSTSGTLNVGYERRFVFVLSEKGWWQLSDWSGTGARR